MIKCIINDISLTGWEIHNLLFGGIVLGRQSAKCPKYVLCCAGGNTYAGAVFFFFFLQLRIFSVQNSCIIHVFPKYFFILNLCSNFLELKNTYLKKYGVFYLRLNDPPGPKTHQVPDRLLLLAYIYTMRCLAFSIHQKTNI